MTVSLRLKNTVAMQCIEVVQNYVLDEEATWRVPVYNLCGMTRITSKPGVEQDISVTVEGICFAVIDEKGETVYEPGRFTLFAGGCQPDAYSRKLSGQEIASIEVEMECYDSRSMSVS